MEAADAQPREDINRALKIGMGQQPHANVEVKYSGPDGVILDVSETGWVGDPHEEAGSDSKLLTGLLPFRRAGRIGKGFLVPGLLRRGPSPCPS